MCAPAARGILEGDAAPARWPAPAARAGLAPGPAGRRHAGARRGVLGGRLRPAVAGASRARRARPGRHGPGPGRRRAARTAELRAGPPGPGPLHAAGPRRLPEPLRGVRRRHARRAHLVHGDPHRRAGPARLQPPAALRHAAAGPAPGPGVRDRDQAADPGRHAPDPEPPHPRLGHRHPGPRDPRRPGAPRPHRRHRSAGLGGPDRDLEGSRGVVQRPGGPGGRHRGPHAVAGAVRGAAGDRRVPPAQPPGPGGRVQAADAGGRARVRGLRPGAGGRLERGPGHPRQPGGERAPPAAVPPQRRPGAGAGHREPPGPAARRPGDGGQPRRRSRRHLHARAPRAAHRRPSRRRRSGAWSPGPPAARPRCEGPAVRRAAGSAPAGSPRRRGRSPRACS